jgi:hypothetical protein
MYVDAWRISLPDEASLSSPAEADRSLDLPLAVGGSLFELRECDLADLPEDAKDAVLLAGALLVAYLEEGHRLPQA